MAALSKTVSVILILLMAAAGSLLAQPASKKPPPQRFTEPPSPISPKASYYLVPGISIFAPTRTTDDVSPYEPVWMEFTLDWTNCQMHRVNDDSPLEIILPGTIDGSSTLYWNLSAASPQPGGQPNLYFVEDVLGRIGPAYGSDIPLTWEVSLDGGAFQPMTLLPDNTLTATFPPGIHTFQVRITGTPQAFQADGYYHLQLTQCLVPEL